VLNQTQLLDRSEVLIIRRKPIHSGVRSSDRHDAQIAPRFLSKAPRLSPHLKFPASMNCGLPLKESVAAVCGSGQEFRKACADEDSL
jgi:hypothetical protein